ncbi:MAG: hypothetical protein JEY79_01110 [Pseudodesulfovibrio sp.]|nr:hypothetical protein [Pseudodesulfovibrio sp.]
MSDQSWNKAGYEKFLLAWDRIHAVNRLTAPLPDDVKTVTTWQLVQKIPADAWKAVYETVAHRETMPRNVGAAFLVAYRKWQEDTGQTQKPVEVKRGVEGPIGRKIRELKAQHPNMDPLKLIGLAVREAGDAQPYRAF